MFRRGLEAYVAVLSTTGPKGEFPMIIMPAPWCPVNSGKVECDQKLRADASVVCRK